MDPFAASVLARARERSKLLQGIGGGTATLVAGDSSKSPRSKTKISTVLPGSPKGQMKRHNVLNFQQEHFDMEIKLASMDKCLVQVEIQEQTDDDDAADESIEPTSDLREESKYRLRRLGKLYSEDENAVEMSSPIHYRTEAASSEAATEYSKMSNKGRSKLAALAQNINQWDSDSPLPLPRQQTTDGTTQNKTTASSPCNNKQQAQKRNVASSSNQGPSVSSIIHNRNEKTRMELNDSVVNALECQGYTRENSNEKEKLLTFKFNKDKDEAVDIRKLKTCKAFVPANRLIEEEKVTPRCRPSIHAINQQKDPSALSLHERKAIFERNSDKTPLLPKAAFASNCPKATLLPNSKPTLQKHHENDQNVRNTTATVEDKEKISKGLGIVSHRLKALNNDSNTISCAATISQQQISEKIKEERRRDMDLLLNRFHKPANAERNVSAHNDSSTSLLNLSACSAQVQSVLEDVREIRVRRNSHHKLQQQQHRLYPVLSDLEAETETERDDDNVMDDDDEEETDDDNNSLELSMSASSVASTSSAILDDNGPTPPKCGKMELLKSPPVKPMRQQQPKDEVEFMPTHVVDGDTVLPLQHTVSFYRKQQQQSSTTPTVNKITRQQCIDEALDSILDEELIATAERSQQRHRDDVEKQLAALGSEVQKQERTIAQASRALTLCNARLEFNGSTEQVEAERLLLVAAHRRQAALYDIGRLQVADNRQTEGDSGPRGDVTVGRITLPLKREYVRALGAAGGNGHHVVCLLKCEDAKQQQVLATRHVSTAATSEQTSIDCVVDIRQQPMTLERIRAQSTVSIEVYCLQAHDQHIPHHVKYHIKPSPQQQQQGGGASAVTPRKLLPAFSMITRGGAGRSGGNHYADYGDGSNKMTNVPIESPGGPNTARSSSFALMGYAVFSVRSLLGSGGGNRQFTLNATPQMSPLEGSVEMREVTCTWHIPPVQRRGFLTMFEDVSGFGAWHRRWFRLDGAELALRYWKYPDDEVERDGRVIDLRGCKAGVGVVPREVCARLHTILLERQPPTAVRYLLSADTKEERIAWCNDLNSVISAALAT